MKILAISDVPSKALWDYNTREKLEGIDLILSRHTHTTLTQPLSLIHI